jgi:hypothetical protein
VRMAIPQVVYLYMHMTKYLDNDEFCNEIMTILSSEHVAIIEFIRLSVSQGSMDFARLKRADNGVVWLWWRRFGRNNRSHHYVAMKRSRRFRWDVTQAGLECAWHAGRYPSS